MEHPYPYTTRQPGVWTAGKLKNHKLSAWDARARRSASSVRPAVMRSASDTRRRASRPCVPTRSVGTRVKTGRLTMRLAILSDTHSRYATVARALDLVAAQHVDWILHCGDIDDVETVELFPSNTHFVFGNCDTNRNELRRAIASERSHAARTVRPTRSGRRLPGLHPRRRFRGCCAISKAAPPFASSSMAIPTSPENTPSAQRASSIREPCIGRKRRRFSFWICRQRRWRQWSSNKILLRVRLRS